VGRELGPTRVVQLERDGRGVCPLGGVEAERALDRQAGGDEDATDLDERCVVGGLDIKVLGPLVVLRDVVRGWIEAPPIPSRE